MVSCFWGVVQLVNNKVKYSSHDSLLLSPAGTLFTVCTESTVCSGTVQSFECY